MRTAFGPPIETKSTRGYWKNSFLWAAALLPSEPEADRGPVLVTLEYRIEPARAGEDLCVDDVGDRLAYEFQHR